MNIVKKQTNKKTNKKHVVMNCVSMFCSGLLQGEGVAGRCGRGRVVWRDGASAEVR